MSWTKNSDEQTAKSGCGLLAGELLYLLRTRRLALYQITRGTQTAGYFRAQAIEYMGRGGMKINLSRRTIYLTLSSSDSGVHLSRAAAEKSAAAPRLKHHRSIFIQILPFCSHHDCLGDCLGDGDDEAGDDLKFLEIILAALPVFMKLNIGDSHHKFCYVQQSDGIFW